MYFFTIMSLFLLVFTPLVYKIQFTIDFAVIELTILQLEI
jgi:hypothetical protein